MLNIILRIKVVVKKVAAVPLTATAVNKSLVLKKINAKPKIVNTNITTLPWKIVCGKNAKSITTNLAALDKVESNVETAEIIRREKIIYDRVVLKFNLIASIKVMPFRAFSARHNPNKENKKIQKELNKNAKKKLFFVLFLLQTNPLSIMTGSWIG